MGVQDAAGPVLFIPKRLLRVTLRVLRILRITPPKQSYRYTLPVAGISETRAQGLLFVLNRAATTDEVKMPCCIASV